MVICQSLLFSHIACSLSKHHTILSIILRRPKSILVLVCISLFGRSIILFNFESCPSTASMIMLLSARRRLKSYYFSKSPYSSTLKRWIVLALLLKMLILCCIMASWGFLFGIKNQNGCLVDRKIISKTQAFQCMLSV